MTGRKTHEQQQRIINKEENTKGAKTPIDETLKEAKRRHSGPPAAYDVETGDRSIKHGANQEGEHNKERSDD